MAQRRRKYGNTGREKGTQRGAMKYGITGREKGTQRGAMK